jgi:hypothetical protein
MTSPTYPVVEERTLDRAKRKFLLGGRREPDELPVLPPGSVFVFQVGGRFEVQHDRRHLSGREEAVVDAVAVSVVDMRQRAVTVDIPVPSKSPADDFTVRVVFRCQVTKPEEVAAEGITDITDTLRTHLSQDRDLAVRCSQYLVDDITAVREWVTARVTAFCRMQPPRINGLSISFAEVHVLTPDDLRAHATGMRDEAWRQLRTALEQSFENKDVERLEAILGRGKEATSALAISRGQLHLGEAAEREYRLDEERRRDLLKIVEVLANGHHLDTAPVDAMRFVDAFAERTIGKATGPRLTGRSEPIADLPSGEPKRSDGSTPPVINEDDLLG